MAPAELYLEKLKVALVALDLALILQYQFLLVVELLFWDCVARPRCAVPFQIHLRLGQDIDVPQEGTLGLQYLRLKGTRIDIDQGVAFVDDLPFDVVDCGHESIHLSGDGRSVDGRDRTDRFQVDADVAFLRNGCGNGHSTRSNQPRSLWPPEDAFVMSHDEVRPDGESERNDPHQRSMLFSGWRRGLRGRQLPPGLLILLFLQGLLTFFHRACLQTGDLPASGRNPCGAWTSPGWQSLPDCSGFYPGECEPLSPRCGTAGRGVRN